MPTKARQYSRCYGYSNEKIKTCTLVRGKDQKWKEKQVVVEKAPMEMMFEKIPKWCHVVGSVGSVSSRTSCKVLKRTWLWRPEHGLCEWNVLRGIGGTWATIGGQGLIGQVKTLDFFLRIIGSYRYVTAGEWHDSPAKKLKLKRLNNSLI